MRFQDFKRAFFKKRLFPLYLTALILSCEQTELKELPEVDISIPSRILYNADVVYKDSSFIKIKMKAPLIEEFSLIDTPYTEFPKGVELNFYNTSVDSPGYMRADWGKMVELKGWYEGKGNVVVISEKGDTLKTDRLFWNNKERLIFSEDTVFIINKDGDSLQANNGLRAKDDLSEYTLFNNQGIKFYEETIN